MSCRTVLLPSAFLLLALLACTGGGAGSPSRPQAVEGRIAEKPDGSGAYVVDPIRSEPGGTFLLREILWGRLVDVHDVDAAGRPKPTPMFRDWVIGENVQSDGVRFLLEENPFTRRTRLVVLRGRDEPANGGGETFESLLAAASSGLPPIEPKHDDGTSPAPFSYAARNACLMLRFDDVLDDSPAMERILGDLVQVVTGYAPERPFTARLRFDPNHGAVVGGEFHSTRVLIDTTVSASEVSAASVALPINGSGLPRSDVASAAPNVSIRIPSKQDGASGQFEVLRNLRGAPLSPTDNGPIDTTVARRDVVRALRAGNDRDANNGFLLDLRPPRVVGSWPVTVTRASADPGGVPGLDFFLDLRFDTSCQEAFEPRDVLVVGDLFVEVVEESRPPDDDEVFDVVVRALSVDRVRDPSALLGVATLEKAYGPESSVPAACWVSFAPAAGAPPGAEVATTAQVVVRFSEEMDPTSVTPADTFRVVRGEARTPTPAAESVVVGTVASRADLSSFAFTPLYPFRHALGASEPYHVRLGAVTDLAGNPLREELPPIAFTLAPRDPAEENGGVVLSFAALDEVAPVDPAPGTFDDLRGQVFFDLELGVLRPREVTFASYPADRANPVPSLMIPFPPGVQTPLTPLGSRLMTVWRYADLGWIASDETKFDLDVVGLSWSPVGGRVTRDFYEEFEIRLAHSRYQPDEDLDRFLLPQYPNSGLRGGPEAFTTNVLDDPNSQRTTVHPKSLGYRIEPSELFVTPTGTPMLPFPLNRGRGRLVLWTWRDTSATSRAAPDGAGVPLDIEAGAPLGIVPGGDAGTLARPGNVPTVFLPLLMEFRCYPSATGIGLNPLDLSLAINSSARPNFRAFSTGGVNTQGRVVTVNPDLEQVPAGAFNPTSNPPGRRTPSADNGFYVGQLDVVVRVSRAVTVWIDSGFSSPRFRGPVLTPEPSRQPAGSEVLIDFRGAAGFGAGVGDLRYESSALDAYGELRDFASGIRPAPELQVVHHPDDAWRREVGGIDGARWFQMRLTFVNDVESRLTAELSGLGVAFAER